VRFEAERNALIFPASALDTPLPTHDPINLQQLLGLCERLAGQARTGGSAAGQVLRHLEESGMFAASIGQVASALGLSERGLRRQLARSSTSYRRLVQEARYGKAQLLLSDPTRSIAMIAFELGFDTPSNFTRSFKQWSGIAPSAFRSGVRPTDQPGRN
jgi:AraC-like DNA-binding protein